MKTAEEVLGETYAALLGSNKNFIISAMEVYAEQARREERDRIKFLIEEVDRAIYVLKGRYGNPYPALVKQLEIQLAAAGYEGKEGE